MSDPSRRPSTNRSSGSVARDDGPGPDPGSSGPSGTSRRGRRERDRDRARVRVRPGAPRPPFLERHRGTLLAVVAAIAIVLVGGFVVVQATAKAYACTALTTPAPTESPAPGSSSAPLGQVQPDLGRNHVLDGAFVRYALCPPASGNHYSSTLGPIEARYYSPDDSTIPQGWIHNLEHGGLVILYSCGRGGCDETTQSALKDLYGSFPASPVCSLPVGTIGPVITRFEEMSTPIAALIWGRVLFQDKLDTAAILAFFKAEGELTNPEPRCPRPSPSPAASPSAAPSGSPAASPSASPTAAPASPEPSPSPS